MKMTVRGAPAAASNHGVRMDSQIQSSSERIKNIFEAFKSKKLRVSFSRFPGSL